MHAFRLHAVVALALVSLLAACGQGTAGWQGKTTAMPHREKPIEMLAGDVDVFPDRQTLEQGNVLMSYADCAACHKEGDRKRGPAFKAIAARYPMNSTYISILAKRIVLGAKGTWGHAVMPPHPDVSEGDAEKMVMYILSLD